MSSLSTFRIYTLGILFAFGLGCTGLIAQPKSTPDEVIDTGVAGVADLKAAHANSQEMQILILWRSKDLEATQAWKKDNAGLLKNVIEDIETIEIVESNTMPELDPDFHLVVAGYCPSDFEMPTTPGQAALDIAKKTFSSAYLRTVRVPKDKARCPSLKVPMQEVTIGWQTQALTPDTCKLSKVYVESGRTIEDIATFPIACPAIWTASYSKDKTHLLFNEKDLWNVEIKSQTARKVPFPHGSVDAAYWEGNKMGIWSVQWLEFKTETVKTANGNEEQIIWYELDGKRAEYEINIGTDPMACTKHIQTDTGWKADEPDIFEPSEGTSAPFCADEADLKLISPQRSSFGDQYAPIETESVLKAQDINGGVPLANGGWAWGEGNEFGGVGITVEWFNGDVLQGEAMAWNGKVWHPFKHMAGSLKRIQTLGDDSIYLCTDKGFGVFHGRTGDVRYWRDGVCLALEASPEPL